MIFLPFFPQFSAMRKEVNNLLRFSNGYISEKLYLINTELTYEYYLQKQKQKQNNVRRIKR